MFKRMISVAFAALLVCGMCLTVFADAIPDLTRKGSIEISMRCGETTVGGGSLTLYRVGEVVERNGVYSFQPVGDFADCGESFADVSSSDLAKRLALYAENHNAVGVCRQIDGNGAIAFDDLELGLYLLVQEEAAEGYNKANPFLVTVPRLQNGVYNYDVEASPKVQLTPVTTKPPENLPQTGQLNWPVPLLTALGLGLFAIGWKLLSDDKINKKAKNEG